MEFLWKCAVLWILTEFDGSLGHLLELSGLFASMHNLEIVPCFFMSSIPCEVFHFILYDPLTA